MFYSEFWFLSQACLNQFSQGLQEMVGFHTVSTHTCTHTLVNASVGSQLGFTVLFTRLISSLRCCLIKCRERLTIS